MAIVKTSIGDIECPELEDIGPRTKFWAEAMCDRIKPEELFMVMGAALEEAYKAGAIEALARFMNGFGKLGEVVDAEFKLVEAGGECGEAVSEGPEPAPAVAGASGGGSVEPATVASELLGSVPESTTS